MGARRRTVAGMTSRTPRVLSIAGSDSGGGAGIQADLKAFARCGVHGMTAITAITAQSTTGVVAVQAVAPEIVLAQVRAVLGDIGVDAVKVGMLGGADVARAVAQALRELPRGTPVVVDPVMVSESGARLLGDEAQRVLVEEVLPLATVATPNVPEARVLACARAGTRARTHLGGDNDLEQGDAADLTRAHARAHAHPGGDNDLEQEDALELARAVKALGPRCVVLTGGHRKRAVDLFVDGETVVEIPGERHPDGAAHGSGCTHSSVLAAQLALGETPLQAARIARALTGQAVRRGLRDVGVGAGPVDVLGLEWLRGGLEEAGGGAREGGGSAGSAGGIIGGDEAAAAEAGSR